MPGDMIFGMSGDMKFGMSGDMVWTIGFSQSHQI